MNRTAHYRGWLALLLAGALVTALPAAAAAAQTPIDPALPTPTLADTHCGSDSSPAWRAVSTPPPAGMTVSIGVPRPTVNGVSYQGVVHAWDLDGSQEADGSVDGLPGVSQSVYVPLPLVDGHTYGWYASTYDGTAYSNPTETCYFTVDGSAPPTPVIADNPDFPRVGSPGTPKKAAGQLTTFSFSSGESLPSGCAVAGAPDCQASGLDHFEYAVDQAPGIGAPQVPADGEGNGSATTAFQWGVRTFSVIAVDAAGNRSQPAAYEFTVPWQLPPPSPTTLSLTAPATSGRAAPLTVSGQLSAGPYESGEVVHVIKSDLGDPTGVALPDAPLSADGTFEITDVPQIGGANTYTVSYPGDTTHQAATASAAVQVSRSPASVSLTTNATHYAYSATATVTAHLGATYNDRTVSIYAQPYGGKKSLVKTGTVDGHGNLVTSYKLTHNTVFTAAFAGDYRYAPATATRTAYDYAKVSESLSGYYTSTRYGSTLYRVYHHTAKAKLNTTVTPNKAGQCVRFQVQRYYSRAWHTLSTSSCHTLSKTSTGYGTLSLTNASNGKFRMRAEYVHSSKDTTNLSTWGTWQFFTVRH